MLINTLPKCYVKLYPTELRQRKGKVPIFPAIRQAVFLTPTLQSRDDSLTSNGVRICMLNFLPAEQLQYNSNFPQGNQNGLFAKFSRHFHTYWGVCGRSVRQALQAKATYRLAWVGSGSKRCIRRILRRRRNSDGSHAQNRVDVIKT